MIAPAHPLGKEDITRLANILLVLQRCFIQHLSKELAERHVSFPQYFILEKICSHPGLTMTEIAEKMDHTTAATTGLVDRLENLGYVQRSASIADRRKVFVNITGKGAQLVERIRKDIVDNLQQISERLTPEEQMTWLQIYEKIHAYCSRKNESEK